MKASARLLGAVVAFGVAACAWATKENTSFTYVDPVSPRDAYFIDLTDASLVEGDLKFPLAICGANEHFVCFKSKALSFSVPKDGGQSEWVFEGRSYSAAPVRNYSLMGRRISGRAISTMDRGLKTTFIYSEADGLISISFSEGNKAKHYFLSEQKGFGSR